MTRKAPKSLDYDQSVSCRLCGVRIYFEPRTRSKNGRLIPLSSDTNKPHDCNYSQRPKFRYQDILLEEIRKDSN